MIELFPTGKSGVPLATLLPDGQILLGRDSNHVTIEYSNDITDASIFIGFDGKPTRKYGIVWTETPSIVGTNTWLFLFTISLLQSFCNCCT